MDRLWARFPARLRPLAVRLTLAAAILAGASVAVAIGGCGAVAHGSSTMATDSSPSLADGAHGAHPAGTLRYLDLQGWSLRYPRRLSLERSTSGPGLATFTELPVANFAQRRAVVTGTTRDGALIFVRPSLDPAGRFPADGVAFRMLLIDGGPAPIGTKPDSGFPVARSTFRRSRPRSFSSSAYANLGVPHELRRLIGQQAGDEAVLGPAGRHPVGSFTLVHAPGLVCAGSVYRCRAAGQPCYPVHAPGRLRQSDLIEPCTPSPAAYTPPGAFYALGWTSEDVRGGDRSACRLRFDGRDEEVYCTNSVARWDRAGRVVRMPPGAGVPDGPQFAFANAAWDGQMVFLPGLAVNPPRASADALLWPGWP
jgi:hypothetical protein